MTEPKPTTEEAGLRSKLERAELIMRGIHASECDRKEGGPECDCMYKPVRDALGDALRSQLEADGAHPDSARERALEEAAQMADEQADFWREQKKYLRPESDVPDAHERFSNYIENARAISRSIRALRSPDRAPEGENGEIEILEIETWQCPDCHGEGGMGRLYGGCPTEPSKMCTTCEGHGRVPAATALSRASADTTPISEEEMRELWDQVKRTTDIPKEIHTIWAREDYRALSFGRAIQQRMGK